MKSKAFAHLLLALVPLGTAFAGSVLVYRNCAWRMTDWKYHAGTTAPASQPEAWTRPDFDDSAWSVGKGAFGYGVPSRYGVTLREMKGRHSTLYLRTTFLVSDAAKFDRLLLDANYTGGFVAWVNGVRVAEHHAPPRLAHDAIATARRTTGAGSYESIELANPASFLRNGENTLAVQAFTADRDGTEFYIDVGLVSTRNLAHNRATLASSAGSGANKGKQFVIPANAVDASQLSFYFSEPPAPQWLQVDLGSNRTFDKARIHWWGDRQPRDYTVQVSRDAATWSDVHRALNAPKQARTDITFTAQTARYVRLHMTTMPDDKNGLVLGGFEVYPPGTAFELTEFDSLATGRPVTASSESKRGSFHGDARMAVNGHGLSWWSSLPADPQWLAVDLGARQPINRVRLYLKENNKNFRIQISDDGRNWRDIAAHHRATTISGGDVKTIVDVHFNAEAIARHVRFFGTERDNPAHGYSIVELAVFRDREMFSAAKLSGVSQP